MSREIPRSTTFCWRLLRPFVSLLLPRAVRAQRLEYLGNYKGTPEALIADAFGVLVGSYGRLSIAGFNFYSALAQMIAVSFCFVIAAAELPGLGAIMILAGAVLGALIGRDAFTHQFSGRRAKPPAPAQLILDSTIDAVCATVVVFASQSLSLLASPSLAVPKAVLYDGGVVFLPAMAALRLALRPVPPAPQPGEVSFDESFRMLKQTVFLNSVWYFVFAFYVIFNSSNLHGYWLDELRGKLLAMFLIFFVAQRNGLDRRNKTETLCNHWRVLQAERLVNIIATESKKGDVGYGLARFGEFMFYACMTLSLIDVSFPWLTHRDNPMGSIGVFAGIVGFTVMIAAWRFVKRANYTTASVARAAIKLERQKTRLF